MNTIHFQKKAFGNMFLSRLSSTLWTREKERARLPVCSSPPLSPLHFLLDFKDFYTTPPPPRIKIKTKIMEKVAGSFPPFLLSSSSLHIKDSFLGGLGRPLVVISGTYVLQCLDILQKRRHLLPVWDAVLQLSTRGLTMCFSCRSGGSSSVAQLFSSSLSSGLMAGLYVGEVGLYPGEVGL